MKKVICMAFIASFVFSCTVKSKITTGEYYGRTYSMGGIAFFLNSDQSFDLNWRSLDYTGKWETIGRNHILLKFDEMTDPYFFIQSGVIPDSVLDVRFINKNKIDMDNYILKRQK